MGPILFSLFIFSPFFLPTSDKEKNLELHSVSPIEEPLLLNESPPPSLKASDTDQQHSLPE